MLYFILFVFHNVSAAKSVLFFPKKEGQQEVCVVVSQEIKNKKKYNVQE